MQEMPENYKKAILSGRLIFKKFIDDLKMKQFDESVTTVF